MDEIDGRILDHERRQMEQIRELDTEELQVEVVDDDDASSDDDVFLSGYSNGIACPVGFYYNTCLASRHTYLGDVDDAHGRLSFLDGGAVLKLPMFYLQGVVLFPQSILPLRVIQPRFIAALEKALSSNDAPYTIGVVLVQWDEVEERPCVASTGTTAEIRQYRRLEDGTYNVVTRGQQRFHLKHRWVDAEGAPCGEVQIIVEDTPLRTPKDVSVSWASIRSPKSSYHVAPSRPRLHGLYDAESDWECMSNCAMSDVRMGLSVTDSSNSGCMNENFDGSSSDDESTHGHHWKKKKSDSASGAGKYHKHGTTCENGKCGEDSLYNSPREKCSDSEKSEKNLALNQSRCLSSVSSAFWPVWVFKMYDSYSLAQRAADMWRQIIGKPSVDDYIRKPDVLSFSIASKLPVSESTRQELLEIDGISYRLQREIELLGGFNIIRCKICKTLIAKRSDMVVMSSDGPLNAYVNPYGYVHEIITVSEATGLSLLGGPVKEHSWFPGYAWTIANCTNCESNMGWLFTSTKRNLVPKSFWGIRSSQVTDDTMKQAS